MPEAIQNLVTEAKRNRFSTLPKLSEDDIMSVWDGVSEFIELQMRGHKGVHIPNLGTFTFIHKKMDIGNNKFILLQRPVFVLSEKFAQTHALQYNKYHTTGEIPIVQLNFTMLAMESPFDRDTVESCVREVLQALARAVASQQNIEFLFRGIGILNIRDSRVKMKFFKDFLNSMDGSGSLVKVLANELFSANCSSSTGELLRKCLGNRKRPGTADSVISIQTSLNGQMRPATNTLMLPRLHGKRDLLPPISEHDVAGDACNEEKIPLPPTRTSNREVMHPHPVVGVSLTADELHEVLPARDGVRGSPVRRLTVSPPVKPPSPTKSEAGAPIPDATAGQTWKDEPDCRPTSSPLQTPEPNLTRYSQQHRMTPAATTACSSPAHHHRAGQELCYLCMQRAMRNIPVSFEEERRRKGKEQDALLQQYQQMKDHEAILKEQAAMNVARQSNQKIAAFNLGVSECVRDSKARRSTDFVKSYVFQNRPLTPLRFYKQEEYSKALEEQVKLKKSRERHEKHDREFLERLEQVQLAEDLAAQRELFLRNKSGQISQYQRALSAQIEVRKRLAMCQAKSNRHLSMPRPQTIHPFKIQEDGDQTKSDKVRSKPLPMPRSESDSKDPIFGRFDATNEKLLEQRERARALYKSQLDMVAEKKKESILHHLTKQKEEIQMLKKTKYELVEDRVNAHNRSYDIRRSLEENWKDHSKLKQSREEEERLRMKTPGMLVLQQTEKYNNPMSPFIKLADVDNVSEELPIAENPTSGANLDTFQDPV